MINKDMDTLSYNTFKKYIELKMKYSELEIKYDNLKENTVSLELYEDLSQDYVNLQNKLQWLNDKNKQLEQENLFAEYYMQDSSRIIAEKDKEISELKAINSSYKNLLEGFFSITNQ